MTTLRVTNVRILCELCASRCENKSISVHDEITFTKSNSGTTNILGTVQRVFYVKRLDPEFSFTSTLLSKQFDSTEGADNSFNISTANPYIYKYGEESITDGGTISYASSNESVATVDADGKVTIKGIGTVTITATASQTDIYNAATASFTINVSKANAKALDDNNATVTPTWNQNTTDEGGTIRMDGAFTYNGSVQVPEITLVKYTADGQTTELGADDYTIEYTVRKDESLNTMNTLAAKFSPGSLEPTDVGSYSVSAIIAGGTSGDYTGSVTVGPVLFSITAANIEGTASATLSVDDDSYEQESDVHPSLTVTFNGETLTEGTDYEVTYAYTNSEGTTVTSFEEDQTYTCTATITGIGNYTGTETATATFTIEGAASSEEVYVLTSTMEAGKEYLIVSTNTAGSAYALGHNGTTAASDGVTILEGTTATNNAVCIKASDVDATSVWTAATGFTLANAQDGTTYYVSSSTSGRTRSLAIATSSQNWTWGTNQLSYKGTQNTSYLYYSGSAFALQTSSANIYIFEKQTINGKTAVELTFDNPINTVNIGESVTNVATATPSRTVTYTSSDPSVATIDASTGEVTGVAKGTVTITATTEESGKYEAATASYTLKVKDPNQKALTYSYVSTSTAGEQYVIVSNGYALRNNNGTIAAVAVTVDNDIVTIEDEDVDESEILWTISANGDLTNNGYYLLRASGTGSKAATLGTTDTGDAYSNFAYTGEELNLTGGSSGTTTYYFYYNSGWYTNTATGGGAKLYETAGATYTVTFDSDGGSEVASQTVKEGHNATQPADPTKDGYAFNGWTFNGSAYDFSTAVTTDITLVAQWTKATKKTVYVLTDELTVGEKYMIVSANTAGEAHAFANSASNTSIGENITPIDNTVTVVNGTVDGTDALYIENTDSYAVWTAGTSSNSTYTTTFVNGDYFVYHDGGAAYVNASASLSTNKNYWTWTTSTLWYKGGSTTYYLTYDNGWALSPSEANVYFYKEVTIDIPATTYTVTFDTQGGTTIEAQEVEEGEKATRPTDPTKESDATYSYTFDNWYTGTVDAETSEVTLSETAYDFDAAVTAALTLYAKWTATALPIDIATTNATFIESATFNGQAQPTALTALTIGEGEDAVTIDAENYTVAISYFTDETRETALEGQPINAGTYYYTATITPAEGNTAYTGTKTVEGTYVVNARAIVETDVTMTQAAETEAPIVAVAVKLTEDEEVEATALETPADYTLTYQKKSTTTDEETGEVSETWTELEAAPAAGEKGDYKVVITGVGNYSGTVEKTFAIAAVTHTVTFINQEEDPVTETVEDGVAVAAPETTPETTPEKTGYAFKGWFVTTTTTDEETGEETTTYADEAYSFETAVTSDLTLTALFDAVEYTITYTLDEGETNAEGNPATYTIETETIPLLAPAREGYTFAGWYSVAEPDEDDKAVTQIEKGSTGNITLYPQWSLNVAAISAGETTTYFETLAAAVAAAEEGQTVTLLVDHAENAISAAKAITIDLGGKTLTANSVITTSADVTLQNGNVTTDADDVFTATAGTLTLGEGLVVNGTSSVIYATNGGKVVIDGAQLASTSTKYVAAYADLNATIEVKSGSLTASGDRNALGADGATITISGGEVKAETNAVFVRNGAAITMSDGTVSSSNGAAIMTANAGTKVKATVNVTGGTLSGTYGIWAGAQSGDVVTVSGGNITGTSYSLYVKNTNSAATVTAGTFTGQVLAEGDATLTISGGWFDQEVSSEHAAENLLPTAALTTEQGAPNAVNVYTVKQPVTVTFNVNGGSPEIETQKVGYGKTATLPTDEPTKDDAEFAGWYGDAELTTEFDFSTAVTEDVTIYAKWDELPVITTTAKTVELSATTSEATITVTGENLQDDITVTLSGDDSDLFTITPTTISKDDASGNIIVTFKTDEVTETGTYTATITLTSEGAEAVTINVTGIVTNEGLGIYQLIDGEAYPYTEGRTSTTKVTYERTFKESQAGHYQSWQVPFDYTITDNDLENFTFYKIHMIAASAEQEGVVEDIDKLYIHIVEAASGTTLKGNKPYVIKPNSAGTFIFEVEGSPLLATPTSSLIYTQTAQATYYFYANYAEKMGASEAHEWMAVKNDGTFAWNASAAATLNSYRWYLKVETNSDDYARGSFIFFEDDEDSTTTGISTMKPVGKDGIEGIYTVGGVKINTMQKGMNVIRYTDGTTRKIFVK